MTISSEAPLRKIIGFRQDEEQHWVAVLECGHGQHVRHQPPLVDRPWVVTEEGRATRVGHILGCVRCRDGEPPTETLSALTTEPTTKPEV